MSRKDKMTPKKSTGRSRNTAGIFSWLFRALGSVLYTIFLLAKRVVHRKGTAQPLDPESLPGSIWVLGCSSNAASDIESTYDSPHQYP